MHCSAQLSVLKMQWLWLWTSIVRMFITLLVLLGLRFFSGYIKLFFLSSCNNARLLFRNFVFIHKSIKHVLRHWYHFCMKSREKVVLNTRFYRVINFIIRPLRCCILAIDHFFGTFQCQIKIPLFLQKKRSNRELINQILNTIFEFGSVTAFRALWHVRVLTIVQYI